MPETVSASSTPSSGHTPELGDGSEPRDAATPRCVKISSYQLFEAASTNVQAMHQMLLNETTGQYIGPMPVGDFLAEFMPFDGELPEEFTDRLPSTQRTERLAQVADSSEEDSYAKFVILIPTL